MTPGLLHFGISAAVQKNVFVTPQRRYRYRILTKNGQHFFSELFILGNVVIIIPHIRLYVPNISALYFSIV